MTEEKRTSEKEFRNTVEREDTLCLLWRCVGPGVARHAGLDSEQKMPV